ncbi:MAG: nuclear transport factor 2 family protein [Marinirhabdus sp.]|nr:nuclear transport factor 2 family protein [Marinirhabdus sp.]
MKNYILMFLFLGTTGLIAQVESTSELYKQMEEIDRILFEVGFNQCNLNPTEEVLTDDFEFYHDLAGVQNKAEFLAAMKKNICGNPSVKITRQLVPGSLQVFPLSNNNQLYGTYVTGEHEFYRQEDGDVNVKTGYAKFTSYFELQNEKWMIKRTFSFDHQPASD